MPRVLVAAPACPALRPFVQSLWYFEGGDLAHARERILPTGTMQLLVNLHADELRRYHGEGFARVSRLRGAVLSGAFARPFGIDTAEQRAIAGVHFAPGGAAPFFEAPPGALSGSQVELDLLWGRDGALLRERLLEAPTPEARLALLEAVLLERARRPLEVDAGLARALAGCERGAPTGELAEQLGATRKRFAQRFREAVGLSPKRFSRVRRFGRVLEAIELGRHVDWSGVAAACGYYDQAHLSRDFREFAGIAPGGYRPRADGDRNHLVLDG